jgi:hypothetical protein
MALGISTQNIKLTYSTTSPVVTDKVLTGLQEVPSMLGKPSKIDVTCLADSVKKSIFGVKDLGDLAFKFVYDNSTADSNFTLLKGLADGKKLATFKVEFPDFITPTTGKGTIFTFDAYVNVETDAVQVDKAIGFTATLALQSAIAVSLPN